MNFEVINRSEVPLLNRENITFKIAHPSGRTPSRGEARILIEKSLKIKPELYVLKSMETKYGMGESYGVIHLYQNREELETIEPSYVLERNFPSKKKEEGEGGEAPAPAPEKKEEKPAEPAPEPKSPKGDVAPEKSGTPK